MRALQIRVSAMETCGQAAHTNLYPGIVLTMKRHEATGRGDSVLGARRPRHGSSGPKGPHAAQAYHSPAENNAESRSLEGQTEHPLIQASDSRLLFQTRP